MHFYYLALRLIQFPCLVDKEEDFFFQNPNKTVPETTLIKRTYVQWAGPNVFRINTVPASLSSSPLRQTIVVYL